GLAADEPARERRAAVVEDLRKRLVPMHPPGLLGPEAFAIPDRARVELGIGLHRRLRDIGARTLPLRRRPGYLRRLLIAPRILSTGRSICSRRQAACRKGSMRRSTSAEASPSCSALAYSKVSTAFSMSAGIPPEWAGAAGAAAGAAGGADGVSRKSKDGMPIDGAAWEATAAAGTAWGAGAGAVPTDGTPCAARSRRCTAAFISSSIDPALSCPRDAMPTLVLIRSTWS